MSRGPELIITEKDNAARRIAEILSGESAETFRMKTSRWSPTRCSRRCRQRAHSRTQKTTRGTAVRSGSYSIERTSRDRQQRSRVTRTPVFRGRATDRLWLPCDISTTCLHEDSSYQYASDVLYSVGKDMSQRSKIIIPPRKFELLSSDPQSDMIVHYNTGVSGRSDSNRRCSIYSRALQPLRYDPHGSGRIRTAVVFYSLPPMGRFVQTCIRSL